MSKGSRQQFAQQEGFIGQSRFGNYADIRVVGPKIAECSMDRVAFRMNFNRRSEVCKRFGPSCNGNVEKPAKQSVNPRGLLS